MTYLIALTPLVLFWMIVVGTRIPWRLYLDKLTSGRYNPDKAVLDLTVLSLLQEPGAWIVDKGVARFPNEGPWRVMITQEEKGMFLELDSQNGDKLLVSGHYKEVLTDILASKKSFGRYVAVARVLIPEEHQVLLENKNAMVNRSTRLRVDDSTLNAANQPDG